MTAPTVAPYGTWRSPITSATLVEATVGLSSPARLSDGSLLWVESRPTEGGRQVLVRDGTDVVPAGFNVRTRVHEYGGRCHVVHDGQVWFSNFADQRLYRAPLDGSSAPVAVTPEPPRASGWRYADPIATADGRWIVCARERHEGDAATDVVNELVAIPANSDGEGDSVVLFGGTDFVAAPRISPDGSQLSWLTWDHPRMPWDGTDLWVAAFEPVGLGERRHVAGGLGESVGQPRWSGDGVLQYVSDRTGWWNLYADDGDAGGGRALCPYDAEFAGPDWGLGQSSYVFLADGTLVTVISERGQQRLAMVIDAAPVDVPTPYTSIGALASDGDAVWCLAASASEPSAIVRITVPAGEIEVRKRGREKAIDPSYISEPRAIEFPTEGGHTAHALYYAPKNPDFAGPEGERPPLIVLSHGGPTGATSSSFSAHIQYWTTRGAAVVDVNYGGSTGYGRAYRDRLRGTWGIVDVDDCVNAARYLSTAGEVDGDRMVIRGGSAGGYTTLCALTFRPGVFAAGASLYGVADAAALARDTHKFESRYLDGLIGPYPKAEAVYRERSAIHHTDKLSVPLILFQGLEDKIVPPDQAETMAEALRRKGIPFAYLAFEGEQHGFRQAENIKRTADAEFWFYGRVLGFTPADEVEPVKIENEDALL